MGKINRGVTEKISIRLSLKASERMERISQNLNLSKAGLIMFALNKFFNEPIEQSRLLNLENKIDLEPNHFPLAVRKETLETINRYSQDFKMKKGSFVGLLVSDYYENLDEESQVLKQHDKTDPVEKEFKFNESLKKKMNEYSNITGVSWSGLISLSVLAGAYEGLPEYETTEISKIYTALPAYIYEIAQKGAIQYGFTENFYIEMCLYRAFYGKNNLFSLT